MNCTIYLFCYNKVNINVSVDEVSVSASSDGSFDSHQTVLLSVLKYSIRFKVFGVSRIGFVCFDPANVLATTESPLS